MRYKTMKKRLKEADEALWRNFFIRLSYELLIEELIKEHPNPKAAFNDTIKSYPAFKVRITDLADLLELDLSEDELIYKT